MKASAYRDDLYRWIASKISKKLQYYCIIHCLVNYTCDNPKDNIVEVTVSDMLNSLQ